MKLKKLIATLLCLGIIMETQINVFALSGSIIYTPNGSTWTNSDVIASLTGDYDSIDNNSGSNTYTFSDNGVFTFDFSSGGIETGSTIATVSWIDKIAPIFFGVESGTTYTGTVTINFSDANLSGATLNNTPYTALTPISATGNYIFEVSDLAGNTTGASFTITTPADTTPPTVSTGIITIGTTGQNGVNTYFKGTIDIKANVSDTGGLNPTSCEYTIDGMSRNPATYNTTYCSVTGLSPTNNITIGFRIKDNANNLTTGSMSSYLFDNTAPTTSDNAPTTSGKNNITVTLTPIETGIGLSGTLYCIDTTGTCTPNTSGTIVNVTCAAGSLCNQYVRYSSTDKLGNTETIKTSPKIIIDKIIPTATIIYTPVSGTRTNTNITATITGFNKPITGLNATGNVFTLSGSFIFTYQDLVGNTGSSTAVVNWIDKTVPTVTTGIIYNGTTGNNGTNLYYNGTISIRADVADLGGAGLSGATCQYTLTGSWNTAIFNTTYCYATGLIPASNITIRFRIQDNAGNTTTGNTGTYLFDNVVPITTVLPASSTGNVDIIATLSPTDAGVGILNTQYCIDTGTICTPSIIGTTANITGINGTIVTKYLRYRSTDKLNNIETTKVVAYTIDKIVPTITGTVTTYSNNTNTGYANSNDIVTILFTSNKILGSLPTIIISGGSLSSATVTNIGGNNYSATYTMKTNDIEGQSKFIVTMVDTIGNTGTILLTGTIFDKTNPTGLSITTPSTGQYVDGNIYTITWITGIDANFLPTAIKLEYSTTNFASSNSITNGTINNGSYLFSFPNTLNTIGKIRLTATDYAGNSFITTGGDFIFDNTPPTDITLNNPGLYLAGNKNYTLTWNGGIDANPQSITILYSIDATTYTGIASCTKTNNEQSCIWTTPNLNTGTVSLRAIAKDKVNQTKLWTTTNFTIDSIFPTLTFTGNSNWRTSPITGSATATDALAGISGTILYNTVGYSNTCDTGSTTPPYYTTDGIRTGYACISDKAGNTRTGSMTYKIDQTAPTLMINTTTIQTTTGVTITITGTDTMAGISGYQRSKISGTGTITFSTTTGTSSKITASTDGIYTIQIIVKDNANNTTTGTITVIWDTKAPILSGASTVAISNQNANYTFTSDTTGTIIYNGTCANGSLTSAISGSNTITRTLANGTYSGCTININDTAGNTGFLLIPTFTINYTAPTSSSTAGGGGGGGGGSYISTCEISDLVCSNNIYIKKINITCQGGDLGKTCISTTTNTGIITNTTTNTSNNTNTLGYTYAIQNKFLPITRQKNYIGTGIITKDSLTNLLISRAKISLKKSVKTVTLYTTTGTTRMTRENVAKTISKFVRNTEYKTGNALQGLKSKGIVTNISYPNNRELNDNILTILMRIQQQLSTTTTNTIKTTTSTTTNTTIQRTPTEQKFISSMKKTFKITQGYKRGTTNTSIKYVQYLLKVNKYYTGSINGTNNDATTKALFARQMANNLITDPNDPAAGYLGPKTRDLFNTKLKELLK